MSQSADEPADGAGIPPASFDGPPPIRGIIVGDGGELHIEWQDTNDRDATPLTPSKKGQ